MKTIYTTREWKGYGKQNYSHYKYKQEGKEVFKYLCRRFKFFDGKENSWEKTEKLIGSWKTNDSSMPEWLHKYIR